MSKTCVFVDGGYLQKVLEKDFNRPRIDFAKLGPALASGFEPYLRMYYYNCPPYQSAEPTQAERTLVANADRFYYALRGIENLEVRLGRLAFRGIAKDSGDRIFEQKRVDVQLAVDLVTLAFSGQIATAVVVAGDSDFIPAFQAAKSHGVRVVLYAGRKNPAHRELVQTADQRKSIDESFIARVQ